jgi:hypothetical protein
MAGNVHSFRLEDSTRQLLAPNLQRALQEANGCHSLVSKLDHLVVAVHVLMREVGFTAPQTATSAWPWDCWRASGGIYVLRYGLPECPSVTVALRIFTAGPILLIQGNMAATYVVVFKLANNKDYYRHIRWQ